MTIFKSKELKLKRVELMEFLADSFMFSNLPLEEIDRLVHEYDFAVEAFKSAETVAAESSFEARIYFVADGECEVLRHKSDGTKIPLNLLKKGDSFGVLGVFGNLSEYPTEIRAKRNAVLISIGKDDALTLVRFNPEIALNVIKFLGNRVAFLNDKIATFSADSVEQKFAKFILAECKKLNSQEFEINLKRTAEAINAGRASLYRALDDLTEKELIKVENKKIYILDQKGLERYTK